MALDNFRKVNITLNKANQRVLETQIAKVGDANGRELVVQITNNGIIEDQTGTTLKLNWQHENGKQGSTTFSVVDIKTGIFSVYYPTEMLYKGKVNASIEITSNGQITNSMNFKIIVQADVFDGEAGNVDGVFISLAEVNKKLDDREVEYVELKNRQTTVENQFDAIQQDLTGKDVVSAPEIIAARTNSQGIMEDTLKDRIDNQEYYINVKSFGAVGDGVTDDTETIQNAINFAKQGDAVLVPFGSFKTTSTILIDKAIKLIMQGKILADHAEIGILAKSSKGAFNPDVDGFNFLDLELKIERVKGKGYQEQSTAVGFKAYNVFNGYIDYRALLFNYTGVQLVGSKHGTGYPGFSYTKGTIGLLKNESINIHIIAENTGWVTQNQFYSGSITTDSTADDTVAIYIQNIGTSVINENTFFAPSIEGRTKIAVKLVSEGTSPEIRNNKIISPRFEMPTMEYLFHYTRAKGNEISASAYADGAMSTGKFYDNDTFGSQAQLNAGNKITFISDRLGDIEYFGGIFYIKPNMRNYTEAQNNIATVADVPTFWDYRILTDGLSNRRLTSNDSSTSGTVHTASINNGTIILIVVPDGTDTIKLTNPPKFSKEFYIRLSTSGGFGRTLTVDTSVISGIVDKTGEGLTTPSGNDNYVKCLYDVRQNKVYVLNYY